MNFNSLTFLSFTIIVFSVYWLLKDKTKSQNSVLLISSYVFYAYWDWRFLGLIIISSSIDYLVGLGISKIDNKIKKKLLLIISILLNLSLLGFFKYFNFFIDSTVKLFEFMGLSANLHSLEIILPVGISFYTFQTMSYSIDVYKKEIPACKDLIAFFAYVSFFPQLVAGPIERAKNFLIQFITKRTFDYYKAMEGVQQIVWGLFKKTVIADNASVLVNDIFTNYHNYGSITLLLGCVYFSIQIYGDFSGYSDIAIGLGKLFGFNLMTNFKYPYFSSSIPEFWRRWHISLSSWFRDYIYLPLDQGSEPLRKIRNIFIVFMVSGLWHGAHLKFIFWGFMHALYFIPVVIYRYYSRKDFKTNRVFYPLQCLLTFLLVSLTWVFFRSRNLTQAFTYLERIFDFQPGYTHASFSIIVILFLALEFFSKDQAYPLQKVNNFKIKYLYHLLLIILIMNYGFQKVEFIYFQF